MVTWWLGAQWFGILGIPLMNGIVNERGTRVESPNPPNPKPQTTKLPFLLMEVDSMQQVDPEN